MGYGYWSPTGESLRKRGELYLGCECVCGVKKFVRKKYLDKGASKSCGCMRASLVSTARFRHGHSGQGNGSSRTYNSWRGMWARCTNPQHPAYLNYGGRGISVCSQWGSFQNFLDDMGERPEDYEMDREDNDGNYQPGNCRWAPRHTNLQNTRKSKVWVVEGREYPSSREAAKAEEVTRATIRRWCLGYNPNTKSGIVPLKAGCYCYAKYEESQDE